MWTLNETEKLNLILEKTSINKILNRNIIFKSDPFIKLELP